LALALIGGEWPASCPGHFTPEERALSTHWIGGWVSPRTGLDDVERSCWASDIRQIEICIAELLVPDPNPFGVEIAIAKLKKCKLPGNDQIMAELIQAGGETLWSEISIFVNSIWRKEELPEQGRRLLFYQFTRRAIKMTVVIIEEHHCYQLHTKFYPIFFCEG
jgi:hypothetical protein